MGWQDAPIVGPATAPGAVQRPAWMSAPVVGQPAPPAAASPQMGPDGTVAYIPDEGGIAPPTPAAAPQEAPPTRWADTLANLGHEAGVSPITDPLIGAGEMALSGITNIGGKILGGVTGIADMAGNMIANPFRDQPIDPMEGAANTSRAVEDFFTYQPGETTARNMRDLGETAKSAYDATGLPPLTPDTPLGQTLPGALGEALATLGPGPKIARGAERAAEAVAPKPGMAPGEGLGAALGDLRAAGYPVRPSDVQRFNPDKKVPGTTREKFAPDATRHEMTLQSQAKSNEIIGRELGLKPGERLDENFDKLKAPELETYQMAENVASGMPLLPELRSALADGQAVVKRELLQEGGKPSITRTLSALRRRANKELNDDRIEVQDRGFDTMALADKIEAGFAKQLEAAGEPQLVDQFRAARERLAKIYDVENATRAGQVDAAALRKLDEKFPGRLTGGLKLVARANEYLPDVTASTMSSAGRPGGTFDLPHTRTGMISSFLQAAARRVPGMDVTTPEFQARNFGPEAPGAFTTQYGRPQGSPDILPQQGDLGLGEALALEPAPGVAPARRVPGMPEEQAPLDLGGAPILEVPPGRVGEIPATRPPLGDVMIDGEPLLLEDPRVTGNLGLGDVIQRVPKKKRKD